MNSEEFMEKISAIRPTLYRICCMQLANQADREDAIQEALFKAWRKMGTLRNQQYFNTWFIRILINECHNIQRRQRRILPLQAIAEPSCYDKATEDSLRIAIEMLEEKQKMCVLLHHIEGYSVGDVARILGISENAVKQRLVRGRRKLKEMLEEEAFEK